MVQEAIGRRVLLSAMPIMMPGIILLMIGGFVGSVWLLEIQGIDLWIEVPRHAHWHLMIYGFLLSLISMEILVLLSREWSGSIAPNWLVILLGLLIVLSSLFSIAGSKILSKGLLTIIFAMLSAYVYKVYLRPSRLGFMPTSYNYLLLITMIISLSLSILILTTMLGLSPLPWLDYRVASLFLPLGAIYSVYSRDLGLITGSRPTSFKKSRILSYLAYTLALAGVLMISMFASGIAWILGWTIISLSAVVIAIGSGLLRSLVRIEKTIIPRHLARVGVMRILTGILWLLLTGPIALIGSTVGETMMLRDALIHMIAIGFIFNTIFGVDAILIYSHMGISLRRAPKPNPAPYILLNIGLILRILFDMGVPSDLTKLSAPITGLAILIFYIQQPKTMRRLGGNRIETEKPQNS